MSTPDVFMPEDRLPIHIALWAQLALALWAWVGCVGLVMVLMWVITWL